VNSLPSVTMAVVPDKTRTPDLLITDLMLYGVGHDATRLYVLVMLLLTVVL